MDLDGDDDGSRRREYIDVEREKMDLGVEREEIMWLKIKGSSGVDVSGCKISTSIFNLYVVRSFASFGGSWNVMKTLRAKIWVLRSLFVRRVGRHVLPDAVVSRLWSRFYLSLRYSFDGLRPSWREAVLSLLAVSELVSR
ncbi:hypothetical protein F2Q70_00012279 [Brassica cretica]|uniref:Uncharacterized protein n=1 Tax=Brassica cretica TaxID=69181 RepID=A0A8S9LZR5_BRACR|nr:hypothetical protein F2Q70_00012279 [Brassica cretica]